MNTIDAVVYINLDHRNDRRLSILNQIFKIGFDPGIVHRVPAIYNIQCGHLGCGQSHIKALELAIQNGWSRTLILEDDFRFNVSPSTFNEYLNEAEQVPWDVLLLAKGHFSFKEKQGNMRKVNSCTTASGYIVRREYYNTLLANFKDSVKITIEQLENHLRAHPNTKFIHGVAAIDMHWRKLQAIDNFYIFDPVVGAQGGFLSDTG